MTVVRWEIDINFKEKYTALNTAFDFGVDGRSCWSSKS